MGKEKNMTEFNTVYEKLKSLSLDEMASLFSRMCKAVENCEHCPFEEDCPQSESVNAWKEFLQRQTPILVPTQTNSAVCELKPCPFCGRKPNKLIHKTGLKDPMFVYSIGCESDRCFVRPQTPTSHRIEDCVEVWNRRADNEQRKAD